MKIFGLGLSRTATRSLTVALAELGFIAVHYPTPPNRKGVLTAAEKYDALTDTPVIPWYKELYELYPEARFILTWRDKQDWINSCEHFFHNIGTPSLKWRKLLHKKVYRTTKAFDKKLFLKVRKEHHEDVEMFFRNKRDQLLILRVFAGGGYKQLCPFLGVETLDKPFPHTKRGGISVITPENVHEYL